jgi:hypothetical protein
LGIRGTRLRGEWRKLHNKGLNDLTCSPDTIRVIKSRRMRWAEHVARMGEKRCLQGFGGKIRRKKTTPEDPGVDGRKILR